MNSIPMIFSVVTGLGVSALGGFLAVGGLIDWGLCLVGLGILGVSFISRLASQTEPRTTAFDESSSTTAAPSS
ncbi:MAG: hypothetical protein AAGI44_07825 [Pseudomonadota bacterium]